MKLQIEINLDTETLQESGEASRILERLAEKLLDPDLDLDYFDEPLHDVEGNKVGFCNLVDDE